MPDAERPWYTIVQGAGRQPQKHLYRENEITSGLRVYAYLRRDLPPDYRINLRWVGDPLGSREVPYDGQIWKADQLIVQESGWSVPLLLAQLRATSAALDPPLEW